MLLLLSISSYIDILNREKGFYLELLFYSHSRKTTQASQCFKSDQLDHYEWRHAQTLRHETAVEAADTSILHHLFGTVADARICTFW